MILLAVLRLMSLLIASELSGAVHTLLDATSSLRGGEHPADDCGDEAGHECPPGCPNCHCTHGALTASMPSLLTRLRVIHPLRAEVGFVPRDARPQAGPDLPPLYRPPRPRTAS